MKTLLVNPATPRIYGLGGGATFPIGLGYIAGVLEKEHDVSVIDVGADKLDDDSLRKRISAADPRIVGITSDSISFQNAIKIAEMVKQLSKEIVVVIGGAHSNAMPDYPLKYDCFDISVYVEGEKTATELWDRIAKGETYEDIKGIAFRGRNGVAINPRQELIENLDELPFPARHLFPMDKYEDESDLSVSPVYTVNTSRGCPFSCTFCSNNVRFGRRYRFRSPENIANEIELLINKYAARGIYFREDLFTANKRRVIDTCREIKKRGLDFRWECESRVDTIDEEMLIAMKDASCEILWCGVESGSQEILNYLDKQITIQEIREAYDLFNKVSIKAGASFMIGIPGETMSNIYETISFAMELKPAFTDFNIFTAYPTSPLYEYVKQNNLYEKEIGHGILVVKTDEFDRKRLEKIQRYVNSKTHKFFRRTLLETKRGTLSRKKISKGIKYILGKY